MYPIKSLEDFQRAINNLWPMNHVVNGMAHRLDIITALNMKVIDLITMIREGKLFYQPE